MNDTEENRINELENKYDGIRNRNFFSHAPYTICNVKQPPFPGVLISFDIQLLIRPSDGRTDPGYVTIRSVSVREYQGQKFLGLPGRKSQGTGRWFSFVELHSSLQDEILEEALSLL